MSFLTGIIFLDAPAAALNNSGIDANAEYRNTVLVKTIESREGIFPYVSSQAIRYWLRSTLEKNSSWKVSPTERGNNDIAYTQADPIKYWDDDIFGYMRAESKGKGEKKGKTLTRVSPFRLSTFLSLAPVRKLTVDRGTMTRQEGDPVLHFHQFYHTVLRGLFSLDLHATGTFSYMERTGFLNLDTNRIEDAKKLGLQHLEDEKSYRLSNEERQIRVATLLEGLAVIAGGAKQALHYTDVTPAIILTMVTKGGNNPLQYIIGANRDGNPEIKAGALAQMIEAWHDQIESPLYVGWVEGFHDSQREYLANLLAGKADGAVQLPTLPYGYEIGHPRLILQQVAKAFQDSTNNWLA